MSVKEIVEDIRRRQRSKNEPQPARTLALQKLGLFAADRFLRYEHATLREAVTRVMKEYLFDPRQLSDYELVANGAVQVIYAGGAL